MNMQGFPRDFLLKLHPELEQAESSAIAPSLGLSPPISSEVGVLTASARSSDEPGVVEIIIRIKLSAHDAALAGGATASPEFLCEFGGKN